MTQKISRPLLSKTEAERLLNQKKKISDKKQEIIDGLPHLYGFKHYLWSRAFFESTNRMNLLCASNQSGKSSTQIRKCIEWATNPKLWPKLWPNRTPRIFWYFYPSADVAKVEFDKKWVPEFLPRFKFKDDLLRGWKVDIDRKEVKAIHFNSGVSVYFKYYSQDTINLQSSTVDCVFCFPAKTLIKTRFGAKFIEDIRVDDIVLTEKGYRRVVKLYSPRVASVISRKFSDGSKVSATCDHPFYTLERGYVPFESLTAQDTCVILPRWKQIKSVYYITALFTHVLQGVKTSVCECIPEVRMVNIFMLPFGKIFIAERFLAVRSFITRMVTRLIMPLRILNVLPVPSIRGCIKKWSGKSVKTRHVFVVDAKKSLPHEVPKRILNTVHMLAVAHMFQKLVRSVKKLILLDWIGLQISRAFPVRQQTDSLVYNFEVEDSHTYFADGFLVHNCDEEIPVDYYNELMARTFASDGYFHMVFTATLGQEMWARAIEGEGDRELFPDAFKQQVSMYDCQFYEDGTPGAYDLEKIRRAEEKCTSEAEKQKRIHGKFIADSGRKYHAYSASRHYMKRFEIPKDWKLYGGADIGSGGSGGKETHPGAVCFIAVRPDFQFGVVYKAWRGDTTTTTAGDILNKFVEIRDQDNLTLQVFDQNAKDFGTIAARMGESFEKAEKSHEVGEQVINTLFQNDMIMLFDDDAEIAKLGSELQGLLKTTPKNKAKDDLADAFRYAVVKVPWDFIEVKTRVELKAPSLPLYDRPIKSLTSAELVELQIMERRGLVPRNEGSDKESWKETEDEFTFWNEQYGN